MQHLIDTRSIEELAKGYMMYEEVRRLGVHEFQNLHKRNMNGERFDDMVLMNLESRYNKV